jgi:hypothetical protein
MAESVERRFVTAFVRKGRRDRLLFELTSPKRRSSGLSRFCHQAEEILDPLRICGTGEDIERFVEAHDEVCCVLTNDASLDGRVMSLSQAVAEAQMTCDAVLIVGEDFAVVFAEPMKGGRVRYLLRA